MVSIIVPMYNRVTTVERCLKSIFNQTYTDWEIIVVDDGSTDGSVELVQKYAQNEKNKIKLVQQEHLGAQAARNKGIKCASGTWIAFLDSDDEWCSDFLMEVILAGKGDSRVVVCTKCYLVNENERSVWNLPGKSGDIYIDLLKAPWPMFQGMLVSKSALEQIGFLDEKCIAYQEWDTAIRLAKICSYIYVDKPLFVYYRSKKTNAISNDLKRNSIGKEYIVKKHKKDIVDLCGKDVLRLHYFNLYKNSRGKLKLRFFVTYIKLCLN